MPEFDYIIDLLEAKGWFLYEGIAHASLPQVIAAGRARTVQTGVYYHLMPAISHDASPEEMFTAASEAAKRKAMPTFNDGVHSGVVMGIHIADGEFAFASKPDSFAFPAGQRATIEDAIKYNLSNYNTYFFSSIDEIGSFLEKRQIAPQLPGVLPGQLHWDYVQLEDDHDHCNLAGESGRRAVPGTGETLRTVRFDNRKGTWHRDQVAA